MNIVTNKDVGIILIEQHVKITIAIGRNLIGVKVQTIAGIIMIMQQLLGVKPMLVAHGLHQDGVIEKVLGSIKIRLLV
jgi:hypothetical protein